MPTWHTWLWDPRWDDTEWAINFAFQPGWWGPAYVRIRRGSQVEVTGDWYTTVAVQPGGASWVGELPIGLRPDREIFTVCPGMYAGNIMPGMQAVVPMYVNGGNGRVWVYGPPGYPAIISVNPSIRMLRTVSFP